MANYVTLSALGGPPPPVAASVSFRRVADRMIEFWQAQFDNVQPEKPDLVAVPEMCDCPSGWPKKRTLSYFRARKDRVLDAFACLARRNRCYLTYSSYIQKPDGTWRNAVVLLGRSGELVGEYHKNHLVIEENSEMGCLYGREPIVLQCDFGRVGFLICFDLNFDLLRTGYAALKPDLLIFSSMFNGGLQQNYWAYTCRCHFLSAVSTPPCRVIDPTGTVIATSTNYHNFLTVRVNLDCRLVHLDYNAPKLRRMKKEYGSKVRIMDPGFLGSVLLSSETDEITTKDLVHKFKLELLEDYFQRALAHRNMPGHIEPSL